MYTVNLNTCIQQLEEIWITQYSFQKIELDDQWLLLMCSKYIDSNTDSIFLYKVLNFDKIPNCSAGIKDDLSRKDKLYNCLTEEFRQRLLD